MVKMFEMIETIWLPNLIILILIQTKFNIFKLLPTQHEKFIIVFAKCVST